MFLVLVAHIAITFCCLIGGVFFYSLFRQKSDTRPIIYYLISGLILLAAVSQVIVLFVPIGVYTQLALVAIILLLCVPKRSNYKKILKQLSIEFLSWSILTRLLFFSVTLVLIFINSGPIIMDDTESYHLQSVKWIQEYGSVPGLVNLHERFGFNSSWFTSVALFSFSNQTTGGITVLNGVLSVWFSYWCIWKYDQFQKENNWPAVFAMFVIFVTCAIIWPLLRGNAASTNYDFIATLITLFLFIEIFLSKNLSFPVEWVIWPVYLFTVRIINFPLLIFSLGALIFMIKQKNFKPMIGLAACGLLLIVPFIIRNVIIAGYPFYPSTSFDLIDINWKPDPQMTERLLEYIKYYNRVSTTHLEIEQTKALGANWVPSWFKYLFLFDKVLVVTGIIGLLVSIVKLFREKNKNSLLWIGVVILWLICWFFISPDPRFVYGILLFGVFLLSYHLFQVLKSARPIKPFMNLMIASMLAGFSYYFISKLWKQPVYRNWLVPAQIPQPPVKEFLIQGVTFRIPEPINNNWNARCYGTKLPCLYKIDPRLKPRGKDIQHGFYLEK